jgi:hypothetical protein
MGNSKFFGIICSCFQQSSELIYKNFTIYLNYDYFLRSKCVIGSNKPICITHIFFVLLKLMQAKFGKLQ